MGRFINYIQFDARFFIGVKIMEGSTVIDIGGLKVKSFNDRFLIKHFFIEQDINHIIYNTR